MTAQTMSESANDLTERDEAVLEVLREEIQCNPILIREETGYDKGGVNTSLIRLAQRDHIFKRGYGLYRYDGDDE